MMRSFRLGQLFGINVYVHSTLLIWVAVKVLSRGLAGGEHALFNALMESIILFAIITAHEYGHVLSARHYGVNTQRILLSPIGGVAMIESNLRTPRQEFVVTAFGPLVNLVLLLASGWSLFDAAHTPWLLRYFAEVNLSLLVFNLIPAFPMDGGRILRSCLSPRFGRVRATEIAVRVSTGCCALFALGGFYSTNLMLIVIAVVIYMMARRELQDVSGEEQVRGLYETAQRFAGRVPRPARAVVTRAAPVYTLAEFLTYVPEELRAATEAALRAQAATAAGGVITTRMNARDSTGRTLAWSAQVRVPRTATVV